MMWPLAPSTTMAASLLGVVGGSAFAALGALFCVAFWVAFGAALVVRAFLVRSAASAGSKLENDGARTAIPTRKPTRTPQLKRRGPCMEIPFKTLRRNTL